MTNKIQLDSAIRDFSSNVDIYIQRGELEQKLQNIDNLFKAITTQSQETEVPTVSLRTQAAMLSIKNIKTSLKLSIVGCKKVSLNNCQLGAVDFLNIGSEIELIKCKSDGIFSIETNALIKLEITDSEVSFLTMIDVRFRDLAISKSTLGILEFKKVQITNKLFSQIDGETEVRELRILNADAHGEIALNLDTFINSRPEILILFESLTVHGNFSIFSERYLRMFKLYIAKSNFHKNLSLSGLNCVAEIQFKNSAFNEELIFNRCSFVSELDTHLKSGIMFQECEVAENFSFLGGSIDGTLAFKKSKLKRDVQIKDVSSLKWIDIGKCEIGNEEIEAGNLQIYGSQIEHLAIDLSTVRSALEIFNTRILKSIKISGTQFLESFFIHSNSIHGEEVSLDANGVTFGHDLNFKNLFISDLHFRLCDINGYANFEGIHFLVPPKIHGTNIKTYLGLSNVNVPVPSSNTHSFLEDFRSLKQIMKNQGNDKYESLFSSCELDCRLAEMSLKPKKNFEEKFEILILEFYEFLNKKGRSLIRPLIILITLIFATAGIGLLFTKHWSTSFILRKADLAPSWAEFLAESDVGLAFLKSLQNACGPLSLIFDLNVDFESPSLALMLIMKILFIIQYVVSTLLIYLLIVGIKRRIRTS